MPKKRLKKFTRRIEKAAYNSTDGVLDGKCPLKDVKAPLIRGLHNLGNTCYLNSLLQCLSHSPFLVNYLDKWANSIQTAVLKAADKLSVDSLKIVLPEFSTPVTDAFLNLAYQLTNYTNSKSGGSVLTPNTLRVELGQRCRSFKGHAQNDSHHALRTLTDCLKQEELKRWQKGILNELKVKIKLPSDENMVAIRRWGNSASVSTLMDRIFGGVILTSIQCSACHTIRHNFEPFLDISLPIASSNQGFVKAKLPPTQRNFSNKKNKKLKKHFRSGEDYYSKKSDTTKARDGHDFADIVDLECSGSDPSDFNNDYIHLKTTHELRLQRKADNKLTKQRRNRACRISGDPQKSDTIDPLSYSVAQQHSPNQLKPYSLERGYVEAEVNCSSPAHHEVENQSDDQLQMQHSISNSHDDSSPLSSSRSSSYSKSLLTTHRGDLMELDLAQSYRTGNLADVEDNEDDSTGDSHPVVTSIHPDSLFFHDSCDTVPACQTVETCLSDQLASLKFDTCAESDYLVGHKPSDKTNSTASMLLNDKRNLSPVCHNFNDTILDSVTSWKDDFVYVKPRDLDLFGQTELQLASRLARQPLLDYTESNNLTDNLRQDGFDTQIGNLEECLSRYTASEVLTDLNSLFCEVCTARLSKPALEDKAVLTKTISEDRLTGEMESGIRTNENKSILVRQSIVKRDLLFILPPLLTIHLKRFQLSTHGDRMIYRLYGVVEHIGQLNGGHYVSYVAETFDTHSASTDPNTYNTPSQPHSRLPTFVGQISSPRKWPLSSLHLVERLRRCIGFQQGDCSTISDQVALEALRNQCFSRGQTDVKNMPAEWRHWYRCSDNHVNLVSLATVLSAQAYILFYERVA